MVIDYLRYTTCDALSEIRQVKLKKGQVIRGSKFSRVVNLSNKENYLKGKQNYFKLAQGLSYCGFKLAGVNCISFFFSRVHQGQIW